MKRNEQTRVSHLASRFSRVLCLVAVLCLAACTTEDEDFYTPEEGNAQILAAYAVRDAICGQGHALTIPLVTRASKRDVDLCVFNILAVDCSVWGSAQNLPAACLAILITTD